MLERFKKNDRSGDGRADRATAVEDRRTVADDRTPANGESGARATTRDREPASAGVGREDMNAARARQRDEYGGINWGAAFFGWLVAVGIAVLLTGILSAAGAAIGLTEPSAAADAQSSPETVSLIGAIALIVVLAIAYYCGGYVAGRMSRFDGARQGIGAWAIGLIITIALAVVGLVLGGEYNVVERANLPSLPVDGKTLGTGGLIATIVLLAITLLAAALGGKAGARYHKKVDRAGFAD